MKIISKTQFFDLWEAGVLGNRTRLWRDPFLCVTDCLDLRIDIVGFRELGKTGGGAWERVPLNKVLITARKWQDAGRKYIMDDGCPDDKRILQGEICRTWRGLEGFLDTNCKLPMRPAIAAGHMRHCTYATVNALLDKFMDPSSREDLETLLELFPDATIEFSSFSVDVGVIPNRRTLFWEVRNY
jgi:hypothetical protein